MSSLTQVLSSMFVGFIAFSTYPELAERVKVFFALGPVTTCTHATSPLMKIANLPPALLRVCVSSSSEAPFRVPQPEPKWFQRGEMLGMNRVLLKNLF